MLNILNPNALNAVPTAQELRRALVDMWYLVGEAMITLTTETTYTTSSAVAIERIIAKNTVALTISLNAKPKDGDEVWVKRTDAAVTVSGNGNTIDGDTTYALVRVDDFIKFLYNEADTEWTVMGSSLTDFMLEVAKGNVTGHSAVNKFGRNSDIAAGTTEDIWDGSALYSFPATALMTSMSQTADQVAMRGATIEVQGLDANFAAVTQNATLDAANTTTVVTLTTALIRVYRMKVLGNVVSTSPIRCHNAGETQDYAIIGTGNNQTLMAIYTVPAGKTAYMTSWYASMNPAANKDPTTMQLNLWARDNANSYESQLKHTMGLDPDATSYWRHCFEPYNRFTEKTDLYVDGTTVGKAADISAGFDLILVTN